MPPSLIIPFRGKKSAKKQKKKKDQRLQEMKEQLKKIELQKLTQSAALKAARKGEPFDPELLNPARKREPPTLSREEQERRYLLVKEWSRYRMQKDIERQNILRAVIQSRNKALQELKKVSQSLYYKAIELNPELFPFECNGPSDTPPIPSYVPPDPED